MFRIYVRRENIKHLVFCVTMVFFLTSCLSIGGARPSQNKSEVDFIIAIHLEASGGRAALLALKSISRIGTIEFFNDPKTGPSGKFRYRTDITYPHKLREEIGGESILIDRGTDGKNYWEWTGTKYQQITDGEKQAAMNKTAERANREILWLTDEIHDLKMILQAPYWAGNSICLEGVKDESIVFVCFDPKTGLMSAKGNSNEYRLFSDWRRAKSIMVPFRLTHFQQSKMVYEVTLEQVEADHVIDSKRFEMPDQYARDKR